jgi:isopentenyldiphosphate isomerase
VPQWLELGLQSFDGDELMRFELNDSDCKFLRSLLANAQTSYPEGWQEWYLAGHEHRIGVLSPMRAQLFSEMLPINMPLVHDGDRLIWHASDASPLVRSQVLQSISYDLYMSGEIRGWRNEMYSCWGSYNGPWPFPYQELFRLERAAFRYFGMRSHASHINGITSAGEMWCGRRALHKSTDPGLLDNLAAGGISFSEDPDTCAVREIYEESGLKRVIQDLIANTSQVITERVESEGWHSERIFVYTTDVKDDEQPHNIDGEVSEFICLNIEDVLQRIRTHQFTMDASCAIATFLLA